LSRVITSSQLTKINCVVQTTTFIARKTMPCIASTMVQPIVSNQCFHGQFSKPQKKLTSKSFMGLPCCSKWKFDTNNRYFFLLSTLSPFATWTKILSPRCIQLLVLHMNINRANIQFSNNNFRPSLYAFPQTKVFDKGV
jgi:hypothetical protein